MKVLYYILEAVITYLAIIGTWEIAQAASPRGGLSDVLNKNEAEKQYNPISALNPRCLSKIAKWLSEWDSEKVGTEDSVISKKRFGWGLRYLLLSIVFAYILNKFRFLFF
jgi:hypothetical protein